MIDQAVKETKAWQYSEKVLSGEVLACQWIIKACERFREDLERDDLIFDLQEVECVTEFLETVTYVPEIKKPVEIPLPHAFWIQQLYGFKYKDSGLRRYREILIEVGRKNYKTFYAACIALYELLMGNDSYPEIMIGANDRDQAIICTEKIGEIIKKSPELKALKESGELRVFTQKEICTDVSYRNDDRTAKANAMPRDPGDGGNPSLGIVDELHEAVDLSLIETIKSGQGQREEPFTLIISSAGKNKQGPLYTVYRDGAIKVLNKHIENDRYLCLIFEQDKEDDWDNLNMIEKANPMIRYSNTLENFVKDRIKEAQTKGGATEVSVKIKHAGVWTDSDATWIQNSVITQNNHGLKYDDLIGQECYLGIDLSKSKDLTVVCFYFPSLPDGIHALWVQCHIPQDKVDNSEDHVDYRKWVDEGWIIVHPGNVLDPDIVADYAIEEMQNFEIKGVAFDQKYAYQGAVTKIAKSGYEEICMAVGQGFQLSGAVSDIEALLEIKKMELFNNPVTRWNFGNVIMKVGHQGDRYPSKMESRNKIDIISAMLTARTHYNHEEREPENEPSIFVLN